MKYRTIVADPPWAYTFSTRSSQAGNNGWHGGADRHYPLMTVAEIGALDIQADDDCVLFLWVPNSQLRSGLAVLEAWGFEFKNLLTWVKTSKDGRPAFGTGYWVRGSTEQVMVATKGRPKPQSRSEVSWFSSRPGRHSEKPDVFYELVERLTQSPRLEMFARRGRYGWDVWGNEAPTEQASQATLDLEGAA